MRHPSRDDPPHLPLLPFLDIVFAVIGIFIVVFAVHDSRAPTRRAALGIDALVLCQRDGQVSLYAAPDAPPRVYADTQFANLLDDLTATPAGVKNLVFALTGDCFNTQSQFLDAFARHSALPRGASPPHDPARTDDSAAPRALFRLSFYPLAPQPTAAEALVARWRGANPP